MDLRKIKKLIELVEESGIAELEVKSGDEAVRIARPAPNAAAVVVPAPVAATENSAPIQPSAVAAPPIAPKRDGLALDIRAPMAGTFYVASEPGAPAFVQNGAEVAVGDVVGIIESMKMMNEIASDHAGCVAEILVGNAEPVSSGQVLMRLR